LTPIKGNTTAEQPTQIERYILTHLQKAIENKRECGVPVSITFAQAILESGGGISEVALTKNNHFGIKHGRQYRTYQSATESFAHHGKFMHDHYIGAVGKPAEYWSKNCRGYGGAGYWSHVRRIWQAYNLAALDSEQFYSWKP